MSEGSPCESCRYYKQGKTWNIAPYKTVDNTGEGLILVVDSHPNKVEDNKGLIFDSFGKCSKEFRKLLNCLDSPYAIASSLGCYPVVAGKETKPSDKEVRNCADVYLHGIIKELNPKVIICLGPMAMKAVLGSRAPKVMEPILNSPVKLTEDPDSPDVIVTNHPAIYWKKDKEYQMKVHLDMLALADDLCSGATKKTVIPFTEITSSRDLKKIIPSLGKRLYFDIENTGNKYDKDRATIWHKGSKLLCMSITDVHFNERRQFVLHGPVLANKELLTELFKNRIVIGHNVHYDIQAFYAFTGIDLYDICEDFECTFAALYLSNQNKIGNSLKKRACELGAIDWAVPVRQSIQDHKQLISSLHKYINSERGKIYRAFKANRATTFDIFRYRSLAEHKLFTRPLNSQDYGDVPTSILYPYNAEDTFQTAEIDEKTVQPMWKNGEISEKAYNLVKKEMVLIAYIERNGLNIDVNRLKALKEITESRLKSYQQTLLQNPIILEAIYNSSPEIENEIRKSPGKARQILKKAISPKGKKFFDALAKLTKVEHLAFATIKKKKKTDALCFDIDALLRICGGLPDTDENQKDEYWTAWEHKTENQKLWFLILQYRKLFDLRTRFIKDVEFYQLDGKVRTTFVLFKSEAFSSGSIGKEGGGGAGTGRLSCIAEGSLIEMPRDLIKYPLGIPIEDVKVGDYVYSYDKDRNLVLKKVLNSAWTGYKKTIKLNYCWYGNRKNTNSLRLTPEHKVRLYNGQWIRADELRPGDRVLSLSRGDTSYGYSRLYCAKNKELKDHKFIADQVIGNTQGMHVHHKDCNKKNNSIDNLQIVTPQEHPSLEPINLELNYRKSRHLVDPVNRKEWQKKLPKGNEHHFWLDTPRFTFMKMMASCQFGPKKCADKFNISYQTIIRLCETHKINIDLYKNRYNDSRYLSKGFVKYALALPLRNVNEVQKVLGVNYYRVKDICKFYNLNPVNHEITSIEEDEFTNVYDLTIEDTEAFFANGILVHNSRNFNFQNLKKDPILRWIFAAGEGYFYSEFDYKSIEPRIMALVSGCKKFKEAFDRGLDLYQVIANEVYNLGVDLTLDDYIVKRELERVCPKDGDTRNVSKVSTLAIMYGESVRGFAARAGLDEDEVGRFFKNFDRMFPEISILREQTRQQLLAGLPIISLYGRTKIYELPSRGDEKYSMKMASILRQAFNFLIQSVANDIMLLRAHAVMEWIRSKGQEFQENVKIVNIIHDSIILRIHKDYLWVKDKIKEILEDMSDVGLKVDIAIGVDEKTAEDLAGNLR